MSSLWWKWLLPLGLTGATLGALTSASLSPLNPDWFSYSALYGDDGKWLSFQGRDVLFVRLLRAANDAGLEYEAFRGILAVFFFCFTLTLVSGKLIPISSSRVAPLAISLAAISLAFARFTIQIREGLAVTLVVIAFSLLAHARRNSVGIVRQITAIVVLLCAGLTHMGTFVFLVALLVALLTHAATVGRSAMARFAWRACFWGGSFLFAIALLDRSSQELVLSLAGDRMLESASLSPAQAILWLIYGWVTYWMWRQASRLTQLGAYQGTISTLLVLLAGPATLAVLFTIYGLLLNGVATVVIVQFARTLHLLIGVNLLLIAAKSCKLRTIGLISVFLMLDQARAIATAIETHGGVRGY